MEKKTKECKRWKLRAFKAERELKLISSLLTQSQLEEMQKQNVVPLCEESLSRSVINAEASLESCQTVEKPSDNERHLADVTELNDQYKVSGEKLNTLVVTITVTITTDYTLSCIMAKI